MSRLDLVVGPNGAGKSAFVDHVLAPTLPMSAIVDADVIAAQRWPGSESEHAYDAARIATATRTALIQRQSPFIAETVFSHPSKLDLIDQALQAGYEVSLHVLLVPLELALARVDMRVLAGGHTVPRRKIRERYSRLWPLVAEAMIRADTARIWDNSALKGPVLVATVVGGRGVGMTSWPDWTPAALSARWP
jgi:predicted ABC-type ATPase